jgi:hypothetical protein
MTAFGHFGELTVLGHNRPFGSVNFREIFVAANVRRNPRGDGTA